MPFAKTKSSKVSKRSASEKEKLYSESGVDLTLIRWMLSLTPAERLQVLQQNIHSILRLKSEVANTYKKGSPASQKVQVLQRLRPGRPGGPAP